MCDGLSVEHFWARLDFWSAAAGSCLVVAAVTFTVRTARRTRLADEAFQSLLPVAHWHFTTLSSNVRNRVDSHHFTLY